MLVSAYILLAVFGFLSIAQLFKYSFGGGLNNTEVVLFVFSVVTTALSAGVIWGGLFA